MTISQRSWHHISISREGNHMDYDSIIERRKVTEQWLREELRASRQLRQNTIQWGVTVIAAVELNLYYVRKDIVLSGGLKALLNPDPGLFGMPRWFVGTSFIALLCLIFSVLVSQYMQRTRMYAKQLGTIQKNQHTYSLIVEDVGPFSRSGNTRIRMIRHFFVRYAPYFIFLLMLSADISFYYLFRHAGEGPGTTDLISRPKPSVLGAAGLPASIPAPTIPKQDCPG